MLTNKEEKNMKVNNGGKRKPRENRLYKHLASAKCYLPLSSKIPKQS
jgi:hypothetical protein